LSKLWNVSRFISSYPVIEKANLTATDRWILSELDRVVAECQKGYSEYNFFVPAITIREFTWNLFAAHYIEMVKARAYGEGFTEDEKNAAIHTLHKVLSTILLLLAPISPFITDYMWLELYSKETIHKQRHPRPENLADMSQYTKEIEEFNSRVWNEKKSKGLSLKDSISIEIPESLKQFSSDLIPMHKITT
jgi:valyl-tRNA synthetase